MALSSFSLFVFIHIALFSSLCFAGDPFVSYELKLSYITASPLGVPQQVIAVNGKFPGPLMNVTTNNNVVVNVWNELDENLLMTWPGIQMRHNSWQDGVLGTNCPIPPKWNWTYQFQVKDQIGSFYYFPSLNFQKASGGFGPLIVNNRDIIPIPFSQPDGDIVFVIGDWYTRNHTALREVVASGKELGMPDGVLINGKGPYRYNSSVPDGIEYETINVDPGKTYRIRVHNVGISTSLNFRVQNHNLLLVETEGYYAMQQNYTSFDVHVGQSYSFLLTMDQNASSDYYIVASARFVNESVWQRVTGVAILHYSNSKGPASGPLPEPINDIYNPWAAMNQPRSIRQNGSASGARPNPQGSFHYGQINVTHTYVIQSLPPVTIDGKLRSTLNGISFVNPDTPIRLADNYSVKGDYKLDFPSEPLARPPTLDRSVINATYKGFIEVILQNNDTRMQSFHVDGYAFFVVGMDFGVWTENSRSQYNKWDGISRSTIEVYPGGWTAVMISLDNTGVWNMRVENLDRWYLGQETYMKIVNPEENGETEMAMPSNVLYCGALGYKQKAQSHSSATSILNGNLKSFIALMMVLFSSTVFFT
ncbi:Cu-oxidase domain-containing protein/Cu-oxidase_2 domain-containing protein/Cu-oxidase_3 domain-containing protein [Cephalotus follicularis]|uniref:Cu-oxidase domain-containing protein/Cu-oxidase_2 domain-containing protein/Cu-oxidase_3 domain-containing protein n=1 Tax=Cephalotus follicularis TaxID=3775 RepID=A0A1Q3C061_CEPFO|nr:Cu-oxidase domain-containing protein/Cu-oxidase_2 domain-containing protein/Cu-oxidase_3 domain-containing protein [Cephalotus follicularis]